MRKWTLGALAALLALGSAPAFGVSIELSVGEVEAGAARVDVVLRSEGGNVGGMQNDILFDSSIVNLSAVNRCTINAAIGTADDGCEEDPVVGPCKTLSRNLVNCGANPSAPGCDGQPGNVSRFRGIIAATAVPNNNAIPDGSILYSCIFDVVDGSSLPTTLNNVNVVASDPFGVRLNATGTNGTVGGDDPQDPTPTPTPDIPSGCTADVCVNVSRVAPAEGKAFVEVVVVGENVGGAQNDILFDSSIVNLAAVNRCVINPAIGTADDGCEEDPVVGPCKTLSRNLVNCGANPSAPGCEGQSANISRFRGIVAATAVPNNNPIPSGSVLYTCEFDVVDSSRLTAVLSNRNIVASNPFGVRLDAEGDDGAILGDTPIPTATPTETSQEPTPTATTPVENTPTATSVPPSATPSATHTAPVVNTPTPIPPGGIVGTLREAAAAGATSILLNGAENFPPRGVVLIRDQLFNYRKGTATQGTRLNLERALPFQLAVGEPVALFAIAVSDDDDGCHIAATGSSNSRSWLLLFPALGLLALRRRRRA